MASSPKLSVTKEWPEQGQWTYEDWERLPEDGWRYEVIDGVLHMTPPPSMAHQDTSNNLAFALTEHVKKNGLGRVYTAPTGVRLPEQRVPLQPDIFFISAERKSIIGSQYAEGAPDLVVEILSPSNWSYDRKEKFLLYQEAGVPEYWIVDPRMKTIEVFLLDDGEYVLTGEWGMGDVATSNVIAGFQVPVADVFADL
jgi:Uma2 family endonuclease